MSIPFANLKVSCKRKTYSLIDSPFTGKFIPTRRTPGISTSDLLERIVSGYRKRDWDAKLEKIGHPELMAAGSDYDSSRESSVRGPRQVGSK
jgi:choline-phosphate cytidylyltransferase